MIDSNQPETQSLFNFYPPESRYIGIVSVPHSGETIPDELAQFLSSDRKALMSDVDYKVNELIDIKKLQLAGVAVITSNIHRVAVDLNRSEENSLFFWEENTKGQKLVLSQPSEEQKALFLLSYYRPYYEMLKSMIHELEKKMTLASFVDLHSMPSRPTEYHMKQNPNQKQDRPDFCLSDRHGLTCEKEFIQNITTKLQNKGYQCNLNNPYIGGYITEYVNTYKTNNIQIEINRALYMDESKLEMKHEALKIKNDLTESLLDLFKAFAVN